VLCCLRHQGPNTTTDLELLNPTPNRGHLLNALDILLNGPQLTSAPPGQQDDGAEARILLEEEDGDVCEAQSLGRIQGSLCGITSVLETSS
jgi:hypothetical protein